MNDINDASIIQQVRAALELVEVSAAKPYLPDDTEVLQQMSEDIRSAQRLVSEVQPALVALRRKVHTKRMEVQHSNKKNED